MNTRAAVESDLRWAIASAPMSLDLPPHFREWSLGGPIDIAIDEELVQMRRVPIGRYFERLICKWVALQSGVSTVESNIQVRGAERTVGEVDLLFLHQGQAYHWELALKFYLGIGDRTQSKNWFGPQGRDRLDLKLAKLQDRQLKLLATSEGLELLAERGYQSVESYGLIKGYLFHPYREWTEGVRTIPAEVNPDHEHGFWIHCSEVGKLEELGCRWTPLAKAQWLSPWRGPPALEPGTLLSRLGEYFSSDSRPQLLAGLDEQGAEILRGFVVPDDWAPSPYRCR